MKKLRILPGAAGIIALTATIGFVDGQRENETESFSREKTSMVRVLTHIAADSALLGKQFDIKPDSSVYLAEIKRGDTSVKVLIDAITGQILLS